METKMIYSERNKTGGPKKPNRNIDTIFFVPKVQKIKEKIKDANLVPTYSDVLNFIEKKKTSKTGKIFVALLAIFIFAIMPIRLLDTGSSAKAYAKNSFIRMESLYQSIEENDFEKAKQNLTALNNDISHIQKKLTSMGQKNAFIAKFFPIKNTNTNTENILDTASGLLKIGLNLADDLIFFQNTKIESINNNENNESFFSRVKELNTKLREIEKEVIDLDIHLKSIDKNKLSKKEKQYLDFLEDNAQKIEEYYWLSLKITEALPSVLGESFDKKYLLLFQNDTELRATGGFIGSYGILTMRDAKIKNLFVDSIYNPDGQLSQKIEPPKPLSKVTENLAMRDANWNPDFPSSAKTITSLYEKEGGFTPDGIIAFDTRPFIDLLEITGPIYIEKYDLEIDSKNFVETIQYKTSIDYDQEAGNPKKLLDDFAPIFIEKIFNLEEKNQNRILTVLAKNIKEKHIQLYSFNENIQKTLSYLSASGEIRKNYDGDYFYYVNSNIGGLKTNNKIEESIIHSIREGSGGSIIHEVEIIRHHKGTYEWPSGANHSYVRFYIPEGSQVIKIENFEKDSAIKRNSETGMIYLEERADQYPGKAGIEDLDVSVIDGKTVVGAWQSIKPGEKIISKIVYEVPLQLKLPEYRLLIQKQAGVLSQKISINVFYKHRTINQNLELTEDKEVLFVLPNK